MNAADAQQWLEDMADDVMSKGGEYGGPLPLSAPDGIIAFGAQAFGALRVVEFHVRLDDGTSITTTRPMNPPAPAQVIPLNRKSSDDECQLCEANWPIRCVNHVDGW